MKSLAKRIIPHSVLNTLRAYKKYHQYPINMSRGGSMTALVCYVPAWMEGGSSKDRGRTVGHSGALESWAIRDALVALDYSVDVVSFVSEADIEYGKYDLVFGFGVPFEKSFYDPHFKGKRIMYLTGACPSFSNLALARRARNFAQRHGQFLRPRRTASIPWDYSLECADAIFVLGNQWTLSTYAQYSPSKYLVAVPTPVALPAECGDRTTPASMDEAGPVRFVWLGGSGALHKGLDLVVDAMVQARFPWHLDVFGLKNVEEDFVQYFKETTVGVSDITLHGFVDLGDAEVRDFLEKVPFVVFPSCSEATAGSVIACMAMGCVPIVTTEAGVDLMDFGILIEGGTPEAVLAAMKRAAELSSAEIQRRRKKVLKHVAEVHGREGFEKNILSCLSKVLEGC